MYIPGTGTCDSNIVVQHLSPEVVDREGKWRDKRYNNRSEFNGGVGPGGGEGQKGCILRVGYKSITAKA